MNGKLIVFEGIDGSGKTTQAERVYEYLRSKKKLVALFREPGGTPLGEAVRKILLVKEDFRGGIGQKAEYLLFAAARSELTRLIIKPLLEQGITILLDRFGLSSVTYQGYGRGLDIDFINSVNKKVTEGIQPDLIILFDLEPSLALSRVRGSGDRIERNSIDFFQRVREGYLKEIGKKPNLHHIIDASDDIDAVFKQVIACLDAV